MSLLSFLLTWDIYLFILYWQKNSVLPVPAQKCRVQHRCAGTPVQHCGCTEVSSMFWKFKWIIFSLLWTDCFDLHMHLGPFSSLVHKSKIKRKARERSEPIIQPASVNCINSDWLQKSAKTWSTASWVLIFSKQQIILILKWVTRGILDRICWGINNDVAPLCMIIHQSTWQDDNRDASAWLCLFAQAVSYQIQDISPTCAEHHKVRRPQIRCYGPSHHTRTWNASWRPPCPQRVQPRAGHYQWRVQWAASLHTTLFLPQRISGKCMALPATCPSPPLHCL